MRRTLKPPSPKDFPACLNQDWPGLPPLTFKPLAWADRAPFAGIRISWEDQSADFAAHYRTRATPLVMAQATALARQEASRRRTLPLLAAPYFSPQQVRDLEAQGLSGIDLCGNGVVIIPNTVLVQRTGQPNRFIQPAPLKNPYRGKAALVARALLLAPRVPSLADLTNVVCERGGRVVLSTVSKTLSMLVEDMIAEKGESGITLVSPSLLLDRLSTNWQQPVITRRIKVKAPHGVAGFRSALALLLDAERLGLSGGSGIARVVATGIGSAERYAVTASTDVFSVYCEDPGSLMASTDLREDEWFPDLEILETSDDAVYFDTRPGTDGFPWASPLECYLELEHGNVRQQVVAETLRDPIVSGAPL